MTIHNALVVLAVACFGIDSYMSPPAPTKLTCIGLAFFSASFIVWAL